MIFDVIINIIAKSGIIIRQENLFVSFISWKQFIVFVWRVCSQFACE